MKKINIYKYIDYIKYLDDFVKTNRKIYGVKSKLAQSAGCQRSHLSLVFKSGAHLTLEQAVGMSKVLMHSAEEEHFFILLVQWARSATNDLRQAIKNQIDKLVREQENLSHRIKDKVNIPESTASFLYSSWEPLAILIAISLPSLRTSSALAEYFQLSPVKIEQILNQLKESGLVEWHQSKWRLKNLNIHLPKDSVFNALNHSNWRQKAVQNAYADLNSLHYTSVCSLSRSDVENMKQLILETIDQSRKIVSESKEEELYCFTCDWFRV